MARLFQFTVAFPDVVVDALHACRIEDEPAALDDAVRRLRRTFEVFTEGGDTPDLRESAEFLATTTDPNA